MALVGLVLFSGDYYWPIWVAPGALFGVINGCLWRPGGPARGCVHGSRKGFPLDN